MTADIRVRARERTTLVGLLAWTYRDQKADMMCGKGLHGMEARADGGDGGAFSRGASSAASVAANGMLGCIIPSTAWQQRPAVHPDAVTVAEAVELLADGPGRWLVIEHARAGTTPGWGAAQHLEPVMFGGRPKVVEIDMVQVRYPNRTIRDVPVTWCPVEPYPSDAFVAMCKSEYRIWRRALEVLALLLGGLPLTRWTIDGIGAEDEPWTAGHNEAS